MIHSEQPGVTVPGQPTALTPWGAWPGAAVRPLASLLLAAILLLVLSLASPAPGLAADLSVSEVTLEPCPADDVGSQAQGRSTSASCFALRGTVLNPSPRTVFDTDVFAVILDASGEPVLPNRTRVGSIGDLASGSSPFALRLSVPAHTPGPFSVRRVKARGFSAPVRTRAGEGDELLPLEQPL